MVPYILVTEFFGTLYPDLSHELLICVVDPDSLNPESDSWNPYTDPDQTFQVNPDPGTDPGFWWSKIEEKNWDEFFFFYQKLQFTYPLALASIKNVQATGEAFSPQKRTSSTSEDEI